MPTYVYECSSCSQTFEAEQRITENPLTTCRCGAEGTIKRVIQPIAVMFKGAGFHINDYAASNSAPKADAAAESKPAESSAEKTESKPDPAPKPEAAPKTEAA